MANTWTRVVDPLVRKALQEVVELVQGQKSLTEIPKNLLSRLSAAEANASQAEDLAYQALQSAASAQETADGKIVSFYQPDPPATASEGDLWFDTDDDNKVYRYTNGAWVEARDEGIPLAIQLAQNAQATADGKIVTYYQTAAPSGASEGDLWIDTDDGNKLYRFTGGVWTVVQDQQIQEALSAAATAQATADGKIVTFYQPDPPTGQAVGDLWFDTDSDNMVYRWDGTAWVDARDSGIAQAINDAALAQATADSKIVTYYQPDPPTGQAVGDLWVDTDDNNHLYRWDGTAWVSIRDQLVVDGYYDSQALAQDLLAGVSLVFKDVSEFDATVPSGLVIGTITLNPDGTVAYGSRGVAITKNGIAGYDDSYNGAGDLPSFEIDSAGNATFRGQLAAATGSFAGDLQAAGGTFRGNLEAVTGTFTSLEAGDITADGIKMSATDIYYYRSGNSFKAIKNVQAGVVPNGAVVNLTGFYDAQPKVIVSPNNIQTYKASSVDADQAINLKAENLSGSTQTGEWSFTAKAELALSNLSETQTGNKISVDGTETHPAANSSLYMTDTWQTITSGNVASVDVNNQFTFTDTDNSRITVNLYFVLKLRTDSGLEVDREELVGQFQTTDWGTVSADISLTLQFDPSYTYNDFRYGYRLEFVSYDGSSYDDGGFTPCYDSFVFNWTETGHTVTGCSGGANLTFNYSGGATLSPDGTLNWIAIS